MTYEETALDFARKAKETHGRAPEWVQRDATLSQTYATLALMAEVRELVNVQGRSPGEAPWIGPTA